MKTVTSISGGQSSAYVAAKYPSDYNIFSLVRSEDPEIRFKDKRLVQIVEDRIQKPFVATLEDDLIVTTILDLEQHIGREINWVSGITFDEVLRTKGKWLPNKLHRYCTKYLKIEPMFYWWAENIGEPVKMQIGYRANELNRVKKINKRRNSNGLLEYKATFEKHTSGRHKDLNKWEMIEWQDPTFPMVDDLKYRDDVVEYWRGKGVRFAWKNNCVHCFNQNPMLIKKRHELDPKKIEWAARQEGNGKHTWRSDVSYNQIIKAELQIELSLDDFDECDTGHCGI